MKVQLWGTRGSVPTPIRPAQIRDKVVDALSRYRDAGAPDDVEAFHDELPFNLRSTFGGDTCCTTIDNGDDEILIIDAGSGIRSKGNDIMANLKGPQVIHIFLSHLH
ncbi:MAG: MBL fold metallo-hydrolase, partial [Lentisphaeria bacterium]|nr:MBL fold metallo-hydrolase [Lentisphaeria bacterium]